MIPDDFIDEEKKWIVTFKRACLNGEHFTEHGPTPRAQQYIVDEFGKWDIRRTQQMNKIQIEDGTDTIKELELEAFKLSNELNVFIEEARRIKAEATMEVETEYETTGDKTLSNQTKRNIEADMRLAKNEYCTTLLTDISEIETILKELAINIAYEKRRFAREMNHIEGVHEIRSSLVSIARDMRGLAAHTLD